MKVSNYLFYVPTKDDTVIIRQMLEGSVIVLDTATANWLQQGSINCFDEEEIDLLSSQGFIVSDDMDEGAKFITNYKNLWEKTDELVLNILPTTNCQLKCPYCYEDGICRTRKMNYNVEKSLLDWIRSHLIKEQLPKIRIVWFGGEPLLCKKQITRLSKSLREMCTELGTEIRSQIVTNGVLLDKEILSCLKQTGLNRLQITIDGSPDEHNKRRFIKKTNQGTFDQIHQGILLALQGEYIEKVDLRVNIDRLNYRKVEGLFSILAADNIQDQVNLSIGPISDTISSESCANDASKYFKENGLQGDEVITAYLHTAKIAKEYGFASPKQYAVGPWCIARNPHAWLVGPDGEMYKCLSMVGRPDGVVGNLPNPDKCNPIADQTLVDIEDCIRKGCPMLPICGGGCHFEKHIGVANCQRALLEKLNAGLLLLEYS